MNQIARRLFGGLTVFGASSLRLRKNASLGGPNMTTWEIIAEKSRNLPADKQQEVLDFVEFLGARRQGKRPLRDLAGLWQGFDVSPEDIADARREMWGNFPRSDI
jgi:hypothetical protein